jgi:hypothetical protein
VSSKGETSHRAILGQSNTLCSLQEG